jgi:predicted outer membrane repeat protein
LRRGPGRPRLEHLEDRLAPAVFTVTNADDASVGSLRWAVGQANASTGADVITFDPTYFGTARTITLTSGPISLTDSAQTAIRGPGAGLLTVSGNNASEVFSVTGAALLSGLTVTQGQASQGGGISVGATGKFTAANCAFNGNNAIYAGGAIYDLGAMTVSGCTFSGNIVSTDTDHTQPADGGAIYDNAGTLATSVTNCTFDSNKSRTNGGQLNFGGALFNKSSGTLTVADCTFTNNVAMDTSNKGNGAALFNDAGASLAVTGCTLSGNTAIDSGNDLYNAGTATVVSSTLSSESTGGSMVNTSAGSLAVSGSTFASSSATRGAAVTNNGSLWLTAGTVRNCASYGGVVYNDNGGSPARTTTVTDCVFYDNNGGTIGGGGIYNNSGTVTVAGSSFDGNYLFPNSSNGGGAIYNAASATVTVSYSTFDSNTCNTGQPGGAIDTLGTVNVSNSTFSGNAADAGGAIFGTNSSSLTVTNCVFSNNSAIHGGGALVSGHSATVSGSTFSNNYGGSGGSTLNDGTMTLSGSTFSGNQAGSGGALLNNGTLTLMTNCAFSGNSTFGSGGGGGALQNAGSATVTLCSFTDNSTTASMMSSGGAVANGGTLTVSSSSFYGNTTRGDGGAVWSSGMTATLAVSGSTFAGNVAAGTAMGTQGDGGGVGNGTSSTLTVSGSTFLNNSAKHGGGAYSGNTQTALAVTGSTFSGNSSLNEGGGIAAGALTVVNSTFNANSATGSGGGISCGNSNPNGLVVTTSTVSGNSASDGGGIKGGQLILDSTIVAVNSATTDPDIDSGVDTTNSSYNLIGDGTGVNNDNGASLNGTNQVGTSSNPINPVLDFLDLYGGTTPTMAVLPGSPVIGAGDPNAVDPNNNPITTD